MDNMVAKFKVKNGASNNKLQKVPNSANFAVAQNSFLR